VWLVLGTFDADNFFGAKGEFAELPENVEIWLGLRTAIGEFSQPSDYNSLVELNDVAGLTFSQIADFIESNPEIIFVDDPTNSAPSEIRN
jgi:hypothetical protein